MFTRKARRTALLTAALVLLAGGAAAQDLNAYMAASVAQTNARLNWAIAAQNNTVAQAQNRVVQSVQAGMANPQMQAQYQAYYQQMMARGQAPMPFQQYVYMSQYTQNFSASGVAHARANENGIAQNDYAAVRGMRAAEINRGNAQTQLFAAQSGMAWERGNMLMGNSTYNGGQYGGSQVLPHTWGANTYQRYNGNNYQVDASGQYYQQGANGWWYPVSR